MTRKIKLTVQSKNLRVSGLLPRGTAKDQLGGQHLFKSHPSNNPVTPTKRINECPIRYNPHSFSARSAR